MKHSPEEAYLEMKVYSASPQQLHLMVVDGAIRFTAQGVDALRENLREAAHLALDMARQFVAELLSGLNEEAAPRMVQNARTLFTIIFQRLNEAELQQDIALAQEALGLLEHHRKTWAELPAPTAKESHVPAPHPVGKRSRIDLSM